MVLLGHHTLGILALRDDGPSQTPYETHASVAARIARGNIYRRLQETDSTVGTYPPSTLYKVVKAVSVKGDGVLTTLIDLSARQTDPTFAVRALYPGETARNRPENV